MSGAWLHTLSGICEAIANAIRRSVRGKDAAPCRTTARPVRRVRQIRSRYTCESEESKVRTMIPNPDIRWKQRFQNFDRAFVLLRSAMENGPAALNPLEKEGVIQRFEYCFELAWKTMKDYLEDGGYVFATVTPRQVLKDAYAAKILSDGQVWIDMLDHRNLLSHTSSPVVFEKAVEAIHTRYLAGMEHLHEFMQAELMK